jgi:hypothetical protein
MIDRPMPLSVLMDSLEHWCRALQAARAKESWDEVEHVEINLCNARTILTQLGLSADSLARTPVCPHCPKE